MQDMPKMKVGQEDWDGGLDSRQFLFSEREQDKHFTYGSLAGSAVAASTLLPPFAKTVNQISTSLVCTQVLWIFMT